MARTLKIVGIGDSTTAGSPGFQSPIEVPPDGRGNPESQYTYWMMRARPEWTMLNRGVDGERSDEIRSRFARDVLEERPDYVILVAGVNDIYQGRLPEAVERQFGPMYAESIGAGTVPVAGTVLPYDTATEHDNLAMRKLNHWIASLARILAIPFCDTGPPWRTREARTGCEGRPMGSTPMWTAIGGWGRRS